MLLKLLLLLLVVFCERTGAANCSWESCNAWKHDPNVINVHLIPHTHDDLGWIKTVDQYYYGAKPGLVPVGVQYIYNTVIDELEKHPNRRFSFAETGFLQRWYSSHNDYEKHRLQKLIKTGQIELIGGGWVQHDEAAAHYVDIIDQMTLGLGKLSHLFGDCGKPQVAWQIDPFGHSKEVANLFAMMGYSSLFFARVHYLEKIARLEKKSLEFIWNTSEDLKTQILTGSFFQDNYGPPPGFCWDALCGDDPIMDNTDLDEYNVDAKVDAFVQHVRNQSSFQRTKHVMLLMGSDFQYTNANAWYENLDKLIQYVNGNKSLNVNVFYSTPSCYVNALTEVGPHLPTKDDDFFPYASSQHSFWTGYFTSRPALKGMIRQASAYLQLAKQLDAQFFLGPMDDSDVEIMKRASALNQHHDAVTGTAKENVTRDYEKRMHRAATELEVVINDALKQLPAKASQPLHTMCLLLNETVCGATRETSFAVTVFNALGRTANSVVRIPFYNRGASVTNDKGEKVVVQVVKAFQIATLSTNETAPYELFVPVSVDPLGFRTYFVDGTSTNGNTATPQRKPIRARDNDQVSIENELLRVDFDANGYLEAIFDKTANTSRPLHQAFFYYEGVNKSDDQPSGAYIFRPSAQNATAVGNACKLELVQGPLVQEVRQFVNKWIYQTIRLYPNSSQLEFDWVIGPIPKEKENPITREVVTRYYTGVKNDAEFFTDANGRQMMQRKVKSHPSFKYEDTEPVAGNYYPVTNRVYIRDADTQCTVLTDRAQGATAGSGVIELMLHRRCHADDHFGVEEALDEPGKDGQGLVVRGVHWLFLNNRKDAAGIHRPKAVELFKRPILAFAPVKKADEYRTNFVTRFTGMTRDLPDYAHLLSLEKLGARTLLLRLEHIFQNEEDVINSRPKEINLKGLFTRFNITDVRELSLGANRNVSTSRLGNSGLTVTLRPQDIATLELFVEEGNKW